MGTSLSLILLASEGAQGGGQAGEHSAAVFILEIALMLLVGRLLGEVMQRMGQPAVMGQLIGGVIIGPSVLGAIWPSLHHQIFPDTGEQKKMIDAVSQLGVLMLLLLTGMETDLGLVARMRRAAFFSSLSGIVLPFACGFLLGEYLPDGMLPDPAKRLATALFLATALSISSVKIVAMVILEVGFIRRDVGQIILASAILDDTVGWIIIAVIGGLAGQGAVNLGVVGLSVLGTAAFLILSFTVGRRLVANVIRWTNDRMTIEAPVITAILILMCAAALVTDLIGVHTVLGAFVVGILVGQSPILTKHIEEQLRGLIVALFAPVFFAVAGLQIDLTILHSLYLVKLALVLIAIASFGKLAGCYVGGRLGGLGGKEATAMAIGMNARGSTEVIVATIGLSMGVLTRDIFTLIVVMAITTTMITPPLLRWALARIPPTGEEKQRLAREEAEAKDFVPTVERLLVGADKSPHGELASTLAGFFVGTRKVLATVLELGPTHARPAVLPTDDTGELVRASAQAAAQRAEDGGASTAELVTRQKSADEPAEVILGEAQKGYDMIFLGIEGGQVAGDAGTFGESVGRVLQEFDGVTAVAVARGDLPRSLESGMLNILVPTTGTDYSRRALEVALAVAKGCSCGVTALHVTRPPDGESAFLRRRQMIEGGKELLRYARELGEREGVSVRPLVRVRRDQAGAIIRQARRGRHNLVVLGAKHRPAAGERLSFGQNTTLLLEQLHCSVLLVSS